MKRVIKKLAIFGDSILMNVVSWGIVIAIAICIDIGIVSVTKAVMRTITPPTSYMDYEQVFKKDASGYILAQGESNAMYLVDMEKKKKIDLGLNADLITTNSQYNNFYLIDFLGEKIKVKEIKKFKDTIINSDEFEIETKINQSDDLEVKVENNLLFVFDRTNNELIQLNLRSQMEEKRLKMPSDLINWAVMDDEVYVATNSAVQRYNAQNELEALLEWENICDISINDGILSILDFEEGLGFWDYFSLESLQWLDGIAFEATEADLIKSSASEPYVYFRSLNGQGGLIVEAVDLINNNDYLVNINLNDVKSDLKFYKGYGYYINQSDHAVVLEPNGEVSEFELDELVKSVYPFY